MTNFDAYRKLSFKLGIIGLIVLLLLITSSGLLFVSPTGASPPAKELLPRPVEQTIDFWNVHLYALPGSDATTLNVAVENVGNSCSGEVKFTAEYKGTKTEIVGQDDPEKDRYVAPIPDFFPGCDNNPPCTAIEAGALQVACDQPELASHTVNFRRYYARVGEEKSIISDDNTARLNTFSTSLSIGQYVIVMPTNAAPGTPPAGVTFISEPYTFRPSGLLNFSTENMSVSINYLLGLLEKADPLTIRMYEWDLVERKWLDAGEQTKFITGNSRISKPTKNFTTYTLGTSPLWCDGFNENIGLELDSLDNVARLLADSGKLKLENAAPSGSAVSKPFTPSMTIEAWKTISYTAKITAPARLTVSVLSADNTVLIPSIGSGGSLAGVDPTDHPSLRLRVEMSTPAGASPELFDWCILAEPESNDVYLPMIIK